MSLKEPRFGEVFRYHFRPGQFALIMYICPSDAPFGDWMGMRIKGAYEWEEPGEIAQRVPLLDSRFSHWSEVPE